MTTKLPACQSPDHPHVTCWGHTADRDDWCHACRTISIEQEICALISDDYEMYNGGGLHIVVEDGNVEHHHVQWCLNHAEENGSHELVKRVCRLMLQVPEDTLGDMYCEHWHSDYQPPTLSVMERSLRGRA